MDSIRVINSQEMVGKVVNEETKGVYVFSVQFLQYSTVRFQMHEETIHRPRFHSNIALAKEPSLQTSV